MKKETIGPRGINHFVNCRSKKAPQLFFEYFFTTYCIKKFGL